MEEQTPSLADIKAYLRYALGMYEIAILKEDGKFVYLEKDYLIEIESAHLFKLIAAGEVIAPFDEVEELCIFIKQH